MSPAEFIRLAKRLRDLGAAKVHAGEYEVVFLPSAVAAPQPAKKRERPAVDAPVAIVPTDPVQERLALYAEELGEGEVE